MFREEYVKANEQIKPDEEFLLHLKQVVAQEDKLIQIGEYVNLEKATSITNQSVKEQKWYANYSWKNVVALAGCFVFVFVLSYFSSKLDILNDNLGIQAGMEDVLRDEKEISSENRDDVEQEQQYQLVQDMFSKDEVIIYTISHFDEEERNMQSVQNLYEGSSELVKAERDELVSDIVVGKYTLKDSVKEFDEPIYYMAELENHMFVYFAVDNNGYINIIEIVEIQSLEKL